MKITLLGAAVLLPMIAFTQKKIGTAPSKSFTIQGVISAQKNPATAYLRYIKNGERIIDSAKITDSKFTFTGSVDEPTLASLLLVQKDMEESLAAHRDMLTVFLDKGVTYINTSNAISKSRVTGSRANEDFFKLNELLKEINLTGAVLQAKYLDLAKNKEEAGISKLEMQFDSLDAVKKKVMHKFLVNNLSSPIAIYVLNQLAGYDLKPAEIAPLFRKLTREMQQSPSGKTLSKELAAARKTAVGQYAIEFSQADVNGKNIRLSSFRGEYVLIDFWASWCGPCRAENPNLVKTYNRFKSKNFKILGVSLDDNKDKWQAAVKADNLPWTHVSDLKGWKNTAAGLYGIRAIPQNILIDPAGKIIAKNLHGEKLENKLATIFN